VVVTCFLSVSHLWCWWCLFGLQVVTRDATPAAGSAPDCVDNVRGAFKQLFASGSSPQGRSQLQQTFKLCDALSDEQQVLQLAFWAQVREGVVVAGGFERLVRPA